MSILIGGSQNKLLSTNLTNLDTVFLPIVNEKVAKQHCLATFLSNPKDLDWIVWVSLRLELDLLL